MDQSDIDAEQLKQSKEYWSVSDIDDALFFSKNICKRKMKLLQAYATADAVLTVTFRIMAFMI